ncbi:MAG TPA: hypothetical protein VFV71_04370 [Burkholderiales bacterium]|nr:hypothetical protein [Burkholderiales bacterium]
MAAKLIAALAVVVAALVASTFQSSMTATNLLSQREQADSTLRAGMFHDLIGQMLSFDKSNGDIPPDRERLLVELLALNFHEHFELKPVMIHVDDRLTREKVSTMTEDQRGAARESLRSVARRVLQRQMAMLTQADGDLQPTERACVQRFDLSSRPGKSATVASSAAPCSVVGGYFDDLISVDSPSHLYTLAFTITPTSWKDEAFRVSMRIIGKTADSQGNFAVADHDFLLTWFDFPFTDNMLLADGTRFSLVLDRVDTKVKTASAKLVWFPKDYFSASERPINHRQFREKLGIALK